MRGSTGAQGTPIAQGASGDEETSKKQTVVCGHGVLELKDDRCVSLEQYADQDDIVSITYDSKLEAIEEAGFAGLKRLKFFGFRQDAVGKGGSSSLSRIDKEAFLECGELDLAFAIADLGNLRTIGASAFHGCSHRSDMLAFSSTLQSVCEHAFSKSGVTGLSFTSNVCIGTRAFSHCDNLRSVCFGRAPENVGAYAFADGGLERVICHQTGKTYFGMGAFMNNRQLKFVSLAAGSQVHATAFENCPELKTLYVYTNDLKELNRFRAMLPNFSGKIEQDPNFTARSVGRCSLWSFVAAAIIARRVAKVANGGSAADDVIARRNQAQLVGACAVFVRGAGHDLASPTIPAVLESKREWRLFPGRVRHTLSEPGRRRPSLAPVNPHSMERVHSL